MKKKHIKKYTRLKSKLLYRKQSYINGIYSFFFSILTLYIYFHSFTEILFKYVYKKSIFSLLMSLYEKKISFTSKYNTWFHIPFFNNECILFSEDREWMMIFQSYYSLLEKNKFLYSKWMQIYFNTIPNKYHLMNSTFFLFLNIYLNKKKKFITFINEYLKISTTTITTNMDYSKYYYLYFFFNFLLCKKNNVVFYIQRISFMYLKPFFDLLDFSFNITDRIFFLFDYCPFYISFMINYLRFRFFYHLIVIYFLWDIISIYETHVLDSEYKYYGNYKQIILKYKKSLPRNWC